jgi:hypothetical protein
MQVAVVALQRIVVRYPVPITIGVCAVTLAALQSGGGKWVQLALAFLGILGYSSWRKAVSRAALASTPKYVSCIVVLSCCTAHRSAASPLPPLSIRHPVCMVLCE